MDSDEFYPRAFIVRKGMEAEGREERQTGRRGRGQPLLREGEAELRLAYRRQCALCGVKRTVIAALLRGRRTIEQPGQALVEKEKDEESRGGDAEAVVALALRALRLWLREMRRTRGAGSERPAAALTSDGAEETNHEEANKGEGEEEGEDAEEAGLSEADWAELQRTFEDGSGQQPTHSGCCEEIKAQLSEDDPSAPLPSPPAALPDLFLSLPQCFASTCHPSSCPFIRPPLYPSSSAPSWLRSALSTLHEVSHLDPQFFLSGLRNLWICKPGGLSRGRGIEVHCSYTALRGHFTSTTSSSPSPKASSSPSSSSSSSSSPCSPPSSSPACATEEVKASSSFICQRYIECPLLVRGHKFDVRVWALLVSGAGEDGRGHNRSLWVYAEGLYARLASLAYDSQSASPFVHLTNHSIQHQHPTFSSLFPHRNQLSLADLSHRLSTEWPHLPPLSSLLPQMHQIVHAAVRAAEQSPSSPSSSSSSSPAFISYGPPTARYALLGFDFMLDSSGGWWLLECNSSPTLLGIGVEGLVQRMVEGMMDIVCTGMEERVREGRRRQQGQPLCAAGDGAGGGPTVRSGARDEVGGWKLLDRCQLQSAAGIDLSVAGAALNSSKAQRKGPRR